MKYDIIVIGAGHAGTEAALAAARMGQRTALVTLTKENLGWLSCNPAIGGVGKGQLVKEIDALGGEMAQIADYAGIQFRILNASKGAAVQSSRAQVDRALYRHYVTDVLTQQAGLDLIEGMVTGLIVREKTVYGVRLSSGATIESIAVIITPGTFLNGLIHVGLSHHAGGRIGEEAVTGLSDELRACGLTLLRFKTGTCARLDKRTIDFTGLEQQQGDREPRPFSFTTERITRAQVPCYITYTNERTHEIIRSGFDRSPLYTGVIKGTGVRYCPSIEDKIMRFGDRERHQIFLEPEGLDTINIYPNGISTSLPEDIQLAMIHSIKGLEHAVPTVLGYGIEHDVVEPTQLLPTMETKAVRHLYCAGQINGTTGYEEAAAQGLVAGINAALRVQGKEPFILDRASSYIGVLIDDLVTKGTNEPYRMFTSRVEYRLLVREDNADLRLSERGYGLGLIAEARYHALEEKRRAIDEARSLFRRERVPVTSEVNNALVAHAMPPLASSPTIEEFLRRPGVTLALVRSLAVPLPSVDMRALEQAEIQIKYAGYIERQLRDTAKFAELEKIKIPADFSFEGLAGLSKEIQQKLMRARPLSLGQASRISGVTPAAIMLLMIYLKKRHEKEAR